MSMEDSFTSTSTNTEDANPALNLLREYFDANSRHNVKAQGPILQQLNNVPSKEHLVLSPPVRALIERAAGTKSFVVSGYQFISKVMAWFPNASTLRRLHFSTLNGIPRDMPTLEETAAYGKMYVKAWETTTYVGKKLLEEECLNNIIETALALERDEPDCYVMSSLNRRLIVILEHFHSASVTNRTMAKLMSKALFGRLTHAFTSPNPTWRANATELFFQAYPMQDPGHSRMETTKYLAQQHNIMMDLLRDGSEFVRYVAVSNVCTKLVEYPHLFPLRAVKDIVGRIVFYCAREGDWKVRQQSYRGMKVLLEDPIASSELREILPTLQDCFHDNVELVRLEFVNLLQAISDKNSPLYQYWDVIPVHHLVVRLGEEDSLIGPPLIKLLFRSFCPLQEATEVLLQRLYTMSLIKEDATRNLFLFSKELLPFEDAWDLICRLLQYVTDNLPIIQSNGKRTTRQSATKKIKGKRKAQGRAAQGAEDPDFETVASKLTIADPLAICCVLDVISILWSVHRKSLTKQQTAQWENTVDPLLPVLYRVFKDTDAKHSIVFLATLVPTSEACKQIGDDMMNQLLQLSPDATDEDILECLHTLNEFGRGREVLELLTLSVRTAWNGAVPNRTRSRCKLPAPAVALGALEKLFHCPIDFKMLPTFYNEVASLRKHLQDIQGVIEERLKNGSPLVTVAKPHLNDKFLELCFTFFVYLDSYLRKVKIGERGEDPEANATYRAIEIMEWADRILTPHLPEEMPQDHQERPFVVNILCAILCAHHDLIKLGLQDEKFVASHLLFLSFLFESGTQPWFQGLHTKILTFASVICHMYPNGVGEGGIYDNIIFPEVISILKSLPLLSVKHPDIVELPAVQPLTSITWENCKNSNNMEEKYLKHFSAALEACILETIRMEMETCATYIPAKTIKSSCIRKINTNILKHVGGLLELCSAWLETKDPAKIAAVSSLLYTLVCDACTKDRPNLKDAVRATLRAARSLPICADPNNNDQTDARDFRELAIKWCECCLDQ